MNNFGKIITLKELRNLKDCTEIINELIKYEDDIGYKRECSKTQIKAWNLEIQFLAAQLSNSKLSDDVRIH